MLHISFAAGSKVALHLNFTKKTYERHGRLRLDIVFPPCDVDLGTAPGWHEVETQALDLYHVGIEDLMSHASVPDQALLASRRHALFFPDRRPAVAGSCLEASASGGHGEPGSGRLRAWRARQQQQEVQGVPQSAAVEPQIEMIHERGAGEAGEDMAGRILEAAKARAKLTLTKPSTIQPPRSAPGGNHENPRLIRSHRPAGHISRRKRECLWKMTMTAAEA